MEIKKGQIWRNVHEEMTVVQVDGRLISIQKAPQYFWMNMHEMIFRATHEWVSDPVETPKVGSWVEDQDGPRVVVIKNEKDNPFCAIPQYLLHPEKVGNEYKPCEPPPLVKALDKLELAVTGFVDSDYEAKALVSEWRAIKAKMGVKA